MASLNGAVDNPLSAPYTVSHAVAAAAGAVTNLPAGLQVTNGVAAAQNANGAALSITSFNTFREQVATAINTLQTKIDSITAISEINC